MELSGHAFVSCELNLRTVKPPPITIVRRNLHNINSENFDRQLDNLDWADVCELDSVDDMVQYFTSMTIALQDKQYPWITYNIKQMMRRQDEAHAASRTSNTDSKKDIYREIKKTVIEALHAEKKSVL